MGADPSIGAAGAETNATYYRDTVHLTPAGYTIVARVVAGAVKRLL